MTSDKTYRRHITPTVTVKDIARLSSTSPSTVSRVLTGAVPVADDKREAVLKAIEAAGYRPNLVARSLKTKSTGSLGLIINDILNPFYGALARGVEDRVSTDGYTVMFCNTNESPERELRSISMLRDKAVDGVIMAPTGSNFEAMDSLIKSGTPLIQLDRRMPNLDAGSVTVDNERGGYIAAQHLLAGGHRRIGFITYEIHQMTVAQREVGCKQALAEAGIGDYPVSSMLFDLSDATAAVESLFAGDNAPTALIAANNRIALAALRVLKQLKVNVPNDLAFVVFDDLEIFELMHPSLTAISQPAYEMGCKAAEFLLAQLGPNGDAVSRHQVYLPELIVRESSLRN